MAGQAKRKIRVRKSARSAAVQLSNGLSPFYQREGFTPSQANYVSIIPHLEGWSVQQRSVYQTPLGPFYLWFAQGQLVYASFDQAGGEKFTSIRFPASEFPLKPLPEGPRSDLQAYFRGEKVEFTWPVLLLGTPFQMKVWEELRRIPHGSVTTYKRIAESLGIKAYRAVGQAVGANPVSVIVPCHRVLGTHGLGGYGGGLNRKRLLLELENVTLAPNLLS